MRYQMCRVNLAQMFTTWVQGSPEQADRVESCTAYASHNVVFRTSGDGVAYTGEFALCERHEHKAFTSPLHAASIKRRPPT